MKKFIILISFIIFWSNNYSQNIDVLLKLGNISSQEKASLVSEEFIMNFGKSHRIYKSKDFSENHTYVVQYVPSNLTNEEIEKNKESLIDEFVIFQFRYWNKGENKDKNIPGIKQYSLSDVRGKFEYLFPYWKNNIDPTADEQKVLNKGNVYKDNYSFSGTNGNWKIKF